MKNSIFKRMLAVLLTFIMVLSVCPLNVFAEAADPAYKTVGTITLEVYKWDPDSFVASNPTAAQTNEPLAGVKMQINANDQRSREIAGYGVTGEDGKVEIEIYSKGSEFYFINSEGNYEEIKPDISKGTTIFDCDPIDTDVYSWDTRAASTGGLRVLGENPVNAEKATGNPNDCAVLTDDPSQQNPFEFTFKCYLKVNEDKLHTVSFDADGGTPAPEQQTVIDGNKATTPAEPQKEGFNFLGWYVENAPTEIKYDFNDVVKGDVDLKAKWEKKEYTVSFDANGGSSVDDQTVKHGETAVEPSPAPTKEYYTPAGWTLDGNDFDFSTPITGSITLVAKWEHTANNHVDNDGDGFCDCPECEICLHTRGNDGFCAEPNCDHESNCDCAPASTYTVSFDTNGGSDVDDQTVKHGETATEPSTTKQYYTLTGWTLDGNDFDFSTPITGSITLVAKWEHTDNDHVDNDGDGFCDCPECGKCLHNVGNDGFCAEPNCPHNSDCECNPDVTGGVRKVTVKATFADGTPAANVDVELWLNTCKTGTLADHSALVPGLTTNENGELLIDSSKLDEIAAGQIIYVVVTGSVYDWADESVVRFAVAGNHTAKETDEDNNEYLTVTAGEGIGFDGEFTILLKYKQYTITWENEDGSPLDTDEVAYGDTPSYTGATPEKAEDNYYTYTFAGWTPEIKAVDGEATYTATYTPVPKSFTVSFDENGGSDVDDQTVKYNETATEPSSTKQYYTLTGWTLDGNDFDFSTPITGSITLVAKWEHTDNDHVDNDGDGFCDCPECGKCMHNVGNDGICENEPNCEHDANCSCEPDPTNGVRELTVYTKFEDNTPAAGVEVQFYVNKNQNNGLADHVTLGSAVTTDADGKFTVSNDVLDAVLEGQTVYCAVTGTDYEFALLPVVRTATAGDMTTIIKDSENNEYLWVTARAGIGFNGSFTLFVQEDDGKEAQGEINFEVYLYDDKTEPAANCEMIIYAYDKNLASIDDRTEIGRVTTDTDGKASFSITLEDLKALLEADGLQLAAGIIFDCDPVGPNYEWENDDVTQPGKRYVTLGNGVEKGTNPNEVARLLGSAVRTGFDFTFTCYVKRNLVTLDLDIEGNGTVTIDGTDYVSSTDILVLPNGETSFTATPDEDWTVASVTFNGNEIDDEDGVYTISNSDLDTDGELNVVVTFIETFDLTLTGAKAYFDTIMKYEIAATDEDSDIYDFAVSDTDAAPFDGTKVIENIPDETTVTFTVTVPEEITVISDLVVTANGIELTPDSVDGKTYTYTVTMTEDTEIRVDESCLKDTTDPYGTVRLHMDDPDVFIENPDYEELNSDKELDDFTNEQVGVQFVINDAVSLASLSYYVSYETLTAEEVADIALWTEYADFTQYGIRWKNAMGGFMIPELELPETEGTQYIVYLKVTDLEGNVCYLGTDGFTLDTDAPQINSLSTYTSPSDIGINPNRDFGAFIDISEGNHGVDGEIVVDYPVQMMLSDLFLESVTVYKDGEELGSFEYDHITEAYEYAYVFIGETVTVVTGTYDSSIDDIAYDVNTLAGSYDEAEDSFGEYRIVATDIAGNETELEVTYEESESKVDEIRPLNKFGKLIKKIPYTETSFDVVIRGEDMHDLMIKVVDEDGNVIVEATELSDIFDFDNYDYALLEKIYDEDFVDDLREDDLVEDAINADFHPIGLMETELTIPMNRLHRTREITIIVFDADDESEEALATYTLKQDPYPDELRIVPETLYFEYEGGIMNKQDAGIVANYAWTADCDAEWVHFDRQGLGSSAEPIWCDPNYTGETRVATITYKTNGEDFVIKTLTIVQYPEKTEGEPTVEIDRIAGTDRLETAIEISKEGWNKADAVVLARATVFADALAGAPLAYALDAPILLTVGADLETKVADEIARLGAKTVYILGGDNAISEDVEKTLIDLGYTVVRLEGATRTETAIEVAKKLDELVDGEFENVFFVSGDNFADALSISPVAGLKGQPILYIRANSTIDASTSAYVKALGVKTSTIVGGPVAVTDNAKASVVALGVEAHRVYGADRFMTSLEVAKKYDAIFSGKGVAIATGKNFPDALAGSVFAAKNKMPVILVGDSVNAATSEYFTAKAFIHVVIFGGEDAVSTKVVNDLID